MNTLTLRELQANPLTSFRKDLSFPHTCLFYLYVNKYWPIHQAAQSIAFCSHFVEAVSVLPSLQCPPDHWGCRATPSPGHTGRVSQSQGQCCGCGWNSEGLASVRWYSVKEMKGIVKCCLSTKKKIYIYINKIPLWVLTQRITLRWKSYSWFKYWGSLRLWSLFCL